MAEARPGGRSRAADLVNAVFGAHVAAWMRARPSEIGPLHVDAELAGRTCPNSYALPRLQPLIGRLSFVVKTPSYAWKPCASNTSFATVAVLAWIEIVSSTLTA